MKFIVPTRVLFNKFTHLLVVMVGLFLAYPFVRLVEPKFPVISFILLVSIILALRALSLSKRLFSIYVLIAATAFLLDLIRSMDISVALKELLSVVSGATYSLFLIITIVIISKRLLSAKKVTTDTIASGVCAYLLLGFLWAIFYYLIYYFDNGAFASKLTGMINFFYFSFTTLTTLGYGDIHPLNKLAMTLTNLEAVTGQIYLAVFIARLVGLHIVSQLEEE